MGFTGIYVVDGLDIEVVGSTVKLAGSGNGISIRGGQRIKLYDNQVTSAALNEFVEILKPSGEEERKELLIELVKLSNVPEETLVNSAQKTRVWRRLEQTGWHPDTITSVLIRLFKNMTQRA